MATVFWDSNGVILIDYLQKGKTITGASIFDKLKAELAEKQPHLQKKNPVSPRQEHLIPQLLPWRKSTNYGLNCLTIRLTHQI